MNDLHDIHVRLRWLRRRLGLSLRGMARKIAEVGHMVSYDSVRNYERSRTVPSGYVAAVGRAFEVNRGWLLHGTPAADGGDDGPLPQTFDEIVHVERTSDASAASPDASAKAADRLRVAWMAFVAGLDPTHPLRHVAIQSWECLPGRGEGSSTPGRIQLRRVTGDELTQRITRSASLLRASAPHLNWVASLLRGLEHVIYVTCADGIVLKAEANGSRLTRELGLTPGIDWSAETMGTNGAGTALREDRVVAMVGTKDFAEPFHRCACLAAPIHDADGKVVGAIDLNTFVEQAQPERLALVAYAALMIERDLAAWARKT